jgi:hypothetical protein
MSAQGKLRKTESGYASFCPGCKEYHIFDRRWIFDGNFDAPTFSPSLLVRTQGDKEWGILDTCCHSFVRDGNWQFLDDCTHELRGQTVLMRNEEEGWKFAEDEE